MNAGATLLIAVMLFVIFRTGTTGDIRRGAGGPDCWFYRQPGGGQLSSTTGGGVALAAVLGNIQRHRLAYPDYDQLRFWVSRFADISQLHSCAVLIPVFTAGATALILSRALIVCSGDTDGISSRVARTVDWSAGIVLCSATAAKV